MIALIGRRLSFPPISPTAGNIQNIFATTTDPEFAEVS